MEIIVSMAKYFPVFGIVMIIIGGFMIGYLIGTCKSIFDDIKSLDYDRIKQENEELKYAYDIIKHRKK